MKKNNPLLALVLLAALLVSSVFPGAAAEALPDPVSLSLDAAAPSFSWAGIGGKAVSSSKYSGRDMILIYGTATENGYTEAFLDLAKPYLSQLKKKKVSVLVGLDNNPTDEQMESFAARYPGIICGRITQPASVRNDTTGLWKGLQAVGDNSDYIRYPVVFLRSRASRLKYYSTGSYLNAASVIAGALAMAEGDDPPATPEPDPTAEPEDPETTVAVEGGLYRLSGGKAVLEGPADASVTSIVMPALIKLNGTKEYRITGIAARAFKGNKTLKEITIGINVTSIGKEAFRGCKKLASVTFKTRSLKEADVGKNAFKGVKKKITFIIPSNVRKSYKAWLLKKGAPSTASFR